LSRHLVVYESVVGHVLIYKIVLIFMIGLILFIK